MTWLVEERWLLCLFIAALVVRLHWNLEVHPLGEYIYSDMHGYVSRADRLLRAPTKAHEYSAFFPFGTHWLVAATKLVFGKTNYTALGVIYACMGATTVSLGYACARRCSAFAIVPPMVGLVGVVYFPLISLSGYILSETPFALLLMATLLFALRLADTGRPCEAWWMGVCAGLGMLVRPQLLLGAACVGLFWIARRKSLPNIKLGLLLRSAIPLALFAALASAHMYFNTGRAGLVSENGSFNLVFGRCHNSKIQSLPDGEGHGKVHFRPPPMLQLAAHGDRPARNHVPASVSLHPALGDSLAYKGYIGDRKVHMDFIDKCIRKTGWAGQAAYSWTNLRLLCRANLPWPDSGAAQGAWRATAARWTHYHKLFLAIPALLGLAWMFVPGTRAAKRGLVAVNLLALLVVAVVYFGGTRHRTPYDLLILLLAFETYVGIVWVVWRSLRALQRRSS